MVDLPTRKRRSDGLDHNTGRYGKSACLKLVAIAAGQCGDVEDRKRARRALEALADILSVSKRDRLKDEDYAAFGFDSVDS